MHPATTTALPFGQSTSTCCQLECIRWPGRLPVVAAATAHAGQSLKSRTITILGYPPVALLIRACGSPPGNWLLAVVLPRLRVKCCVVVLNFRFLSSSFLTREVCHHPPPTLCPPLALHGPHLLNTLITMVYIMSAVSDLVVAATFMVSVHDLEGFGSCTAPSHLQQQSSLHAHQLPLPLPLLIIIAPHLTVAMLTSFFHSAFDHKTSNQSH